MNDPATIAEASAFSKSTKTRHQIPLRRKLAYASFAILALALIGELLCRCLFWRPVALDDLVMSKYPLGEYGDAPASLKGSVSLGEKSFFLQTNSQGFRANRDYVVPKPAGTFRILCVGDSYTFGNYVDNWETYPYQLEEILHDDGYTSVEVINAGIGGYNLADEMGYVLSKALRIEPDLILFQPLHNDLNLYLLADDIHPERPASRRDPRTYSVMKKMRFALLAIRDRSALITALADPVVGASVLRWWRDQDAPKAANADSEWKDFNAETAFPETDARSMRLVDDYIRHFARIKDFANENKIQLWILAGDSPAFARIAEPEGLRVIRADLALKAMPFRKAQRLHPVDSHFSKYGNAIIAEAVRAELVTSGVLVKRDQE